MAPTGWMCLCVSPSTPRRRRTRSCKAAGRTSTRCCRQGRASSRAACWSATPRSGVRRPVASTVCVASEERRSAPGPFLKHRRVRVSPARGRARPRRRARWQAGRQRIRGPPDAHRHGLEGRCQAVRIDVFERDQRLGLRVVAAAAAFGDVVADQRQAANDAIRLLVFERGRDIHQIAFAKAQPCQVRVVDEQDVPPAEDAAVSVVQAVDRRVVLIVRSHRHELEDIPARREHVFLQAGEDREVRLVALGLPQPDAVRHSGAGSRPVP